MDEINLGIGYVQRLLFHVEIRGEVKKKIY